jgi:hypothetical protein
MSIDLEIAFEEAVIRHNAAIDAAGRRPPAHTQAVLDRIARDTNGATTEADMPAGAMARLDAWLSNADWREARTWVASAAAAQAELQAASAAFHDLRRERERAHLEASRAQKVEEARDATAGPLRAVRDAELRELGAGVQALARLERVEGTVADLAVLTMPLLKGTRVTKRDERGRILETERAAVPA